MTPKQKRLLDFYAAFMDAKGYAPSQMEAARHMRVKHPAAIARMLKRLEARGLIERDPDETIRNVKTVAAELPAVRLRENRDSRWKNLKKIIMFQ